MKLPCPTAEQCSARAVVHDDDVVRCYAIWYPQMGGYVGKAIAEICKNGEGCVDVLVWHDGEFPFGEGEPREPREPRELHHCDPEQFVQFGHDLMRMQKECEQ